MDKVTAIIGIVLLIGGIAFSFLPHEAHKTVLAYVVHQHAHEDSHGEHGSHDLHRNLGYGMAIAGLALTIFGVKRK